MNTTKHSEEIKASKYFEKNTYFLVDTMFDGFEYYTHFEDVRIDYEDKSRSLLSNAVGNSGISNKVKLNREIVVFEKTLQDKLIIIKQISVELS
jgi:hypothetical protein